MSACNFTQQVSPNTCIGDSLAVFNSNFSSLDEGLCNIPITVSGPGVNVRVEHNEQMVPIAKVAATNSFAYGKKFDFARNVGTDTITVPNQNKYEITSFNNATPLSPNVSVASIIVPLIAPVPPRITISWTAPGEDNLTVYATNSGTSFADPGPIGFNGTVNCLLYSENKLYVGGEFTTVGGVDCKKFCILNLEGGSSFPELENVGTLVGNPLSSYGDLGTIGTIHAITEYNRLLIVGGSFQSLSKGRGLTILDRSTGIVYPFYVNGTVNDLIVQGTDLYVGGEFNYLNYTSQSVSEYSGLRVYTNGLAKISLSMLLSFPNHSIDKSFAEKILSNRFGGLASINAFAKKDNTLYIGGRFQTSRNGSINSSGLGMLSATGELDEAWDPLVGGEVYTLAVDGNYLYVGGSFDSFYTADQYKLSPRTIDESTKAYNAICFDVEYSNAPVLEYNWKPKFNGAVTRFAFHDDTYASYVYCYGKFTQVNNSRVGYIAAIKKSFTNIETGTEVLDWRANFQKGPETINQAMIRFNESLIVSGNFESINNQPRKRLARINGVNESVLTRPLSAVVWGFGANVLSNGSTLQTDFTNFEVVSSYSNGVNTLTETSFRLNPSVTKGASEGDLLQIFVNRPITVKAYPQPVYVLGWKVEYN